MATLDSGDGVIVPSLVSDTPKQGTKFVGTNTANKTRLIALPVIFKTVDTYALMIADGVPTISPVVYIVLSDEKNSETGIYIWYTNGKRRFIATQDDL